MAKLSKLFFRNVFNPSEVTVAYQDILFRLFYVALGRTPFSCFPKSSVQVIINSEMERFGCYFSLFLMKVAELGGNNEEKVRGNFRRTKVLILDTGVAGLTLSCKNTARKCLHRLPHPRSSKLHRWAFQTEVLPWSESWGIHYACNKRNPLWELNEKYIPKRHFH